MIEFIRLENFKGHRDSTISLGRFTVLVGPNGAGKTSVLDALEIQSQIIHLTPDIAFTGNRSFGDMLRRGAQSAMVLTSGGVLKGKAFSFRSEIAAPLTTGFEWTLGGDTRSQYSPVGSEPVPRACNSLQAQRRAHCSSRVQR